ncbi:RecF/RecN/SMC N terminal domain-containing protein [Besnoitia besnoiti]|uniref:RecF/RecN/SMC N terminal domain-containing protein n=1 Tax=Besnoitia besnoiti TaxID=94643 RepID=A0A2A9M4U6_BESBE|nr:RecF/RecN/SMC N terminal domain-containing protein [Besnoitia besnoiti]PFH33508.1 RecF/RecN/SMC N terminal domain-containing protein [Besnoitia besnoiti]
MATLERLGVQGIRCFAPDHLEVIAFEKPLTVIVGHNGAGKTTVVECLKYATTGELPPCVDRGRGWLHDPRLLDAAEVKGQVRLRIHTKGGKELTVVRSMQVSQTIDRKGQCKATFKQLEPYLQLKDSATGKKASIGNKCADIDVQLPGLLGIHRAVLEHVVFCHQEDSCWPLSEMPVLKKKFDQLFGATRYVKALEHIRATRKQHAAEAKDRQHDVQLVGGHRRQARLLRRQLEEAKSLEREEEEQLRSTGASLERHAALLRAREEAQAREAAVRRQLEVSIRLVARLEEELEEQKAAQESERREEREREREHRRLARARAAERRQREDGEGPSSCDHAEAEDEAERAWRKEEEEEEKFRLAVEQEGYQELVDLAKDIEQQFAAKRDRLAALEGDLLRRENESAALTERLHAEQHKAAEGIRAEERKATALTERTKIVRSLLRGCRGKLVGAEDDASEEGGPRDQEGVALRSDAAIHEEVERHLERLHREKAAAAREGERRAQEMKEESDRLQEKCAALQALVGAGDELLTHLRKETRALTEAKQRKRPREDVARELQRITAEEDAERGRDREEGETTSAAARIADLEATLKRVDEQLQALRCRRGVLDRRRRLAEEQSERQMSLQLAKQRLKEMEKDVAERQGTFISDVAAWRTIAASKADAGDAHSTEMSFDEAVAFVSSQAEQRKGEKAREHQKAAAASLNSCRGQGELGASSLRSLLLAFRQNLLRAASFSSASPSSLFASSPGESSDAAGRLRSTAWPPHLLQLLKDSALRSRDLARDQWRQGAPASASSGGAAPASSPPQGAQPGEADGPLDSDDLVSADASLLLAVYEEGRHARAAADVARDIERLKREADDLASLYAGAQDACAAADSSRAFAAQGWLHALAQESERGNACALCKREFRTPEELRATQEEVERRVEALPQQVRDAEARQKEIRNQLDNLQEERLLFAALAKQNEEICQKRALLKMLRQNLGHLEDQVRIAEQLAEEATRSDENLKRLLETANALHQLQTAGLRKARHDVDAAEAQLRAAVAAVVKASSAAPVSEGCGVDSSGDASHSFLDMEEINKAFEALEDEQSKVYALRDETQATLTAAVEARFARHQRLDNLKRRREDLQREVQEVRQLEGQIEKNATAIYAKEGELPGQKAELARMQQRAAEASASLRTEEKRVEDALRKFDEQIKSIQKERELLSETSRAIAEADVALTRARESSAVTAELTQLRAKREELNAQLGRMKKAREEQRTACGRGQRFLALVKNRVALFHKEEDIERERKRIAELGAQLRADRCRRRRETPGGGVGEGDSAADGPGAEDAAGAEPEDESENELEREIEALRRKTEQEKDTRARLEGSLMTRRERVKEIETELAGSAVYKDVEEKYRSALVDAETEAMVTKDLDRYHRALDKALMKYHSMKMQEINATMKELWQTMYTGHDIDYIAIRSDTEETASPAALSIFGSSAATAPAAGQRSYNYRLVMVKGSVELEMRGRCSAGQKILASLIVRLALAETFCVHCGVLALDEPTTNLDRYNCESLAKALAALVEARRTSTSFQLILITHDEQFVMRLARHGLCDKFYKISKALSGESRITCCDIHGF